MADAQNFDPQQFSQQLADTVSKQLAAQFAQTKAALDAEAARMAEANRLLTNKLIPGANLPSTFSAEDFALLQTINANPKLKEAVVALAKGFATPAPPGGGS